MVFVRPPIEQELCPEGTPTDGFHCVHWYDGEPCCRCGAPAMTEEERREQGMIADEYAGKVEG